MAVSRPKSSRGNQRPLSVRPQNIQRISALSDLDKREFIYDCGSACWTAGENMAVERVPLNQAIRVSALTPMRDR